MQIFFILHGWAVRGGDKNQAMWQPFIDELKDANKKNVPSNINDVKIKNSENLKIIFLKIPGLSAPLNEVWNLDNFVNWLEGEIENQLGKLSSLNERVKTTKSKFKPNNQKIILLGHSFGGQLAIRYASKNQEKLEKLILLDSAGIRDMAPKAVIKRTVFLLLAKVGKLLFSFRTDLFRNILHKLARESDYKNAPPLLRRTMSKILDDEVLNDLPKIKTKTKIIWGENDKVTPVKHAHKMNQLIKNSELEFIKDGRHSPQFTHPKETAKLVIKFLLKD